VYGTFVKMSKPKENADHYLEIGFYDKAGSLKPGESNLKWVLLKTDDSYNRVRKAGIRKGTVRHPLVQDKTCISKEFYMELYISNVGDLPPHLKQKKE